MLTDGGLAPALRALVKACKVPVELVAVPPDRFAQQVEAAAYFVVAEALTNVARYSGASSASVELSREDGRLLVEVRDDGRGGADPERGSGLRRQRLLRCPPRPSTEIRRHPDREIRRFATPAAQIS